MINYLLTFFFYKLLTILKNDPSKQLLIEINLQQLTHSKRIIINDTFSFVLI